MNSTFLDFIVVVGMVVAILIGVEISLTPVSQASYTIVFKQKT